MRGACGAAQASRHPSAARPTTPYSSAIVRSVPPLSRSTSVRSRSRRSFSASFDSSVSSLVVASEIWPGARDPGRGARLPSGVKILDRLASRTSRRTCSSWAPLAGERHPRVPGRPCRNAARSRRADPVEVPAAVGFVPRSELGAYYERAAVVCVPSRREATASWRGRRWRTRPGWRRGSSGLVDAMESLFRAATSRGCARCSSSCSRMPTGARISARRRESGARAAVAARRRAALRTAYQAVV